MDFTANDVTVHARANIEKDEMQVHNHQLNDNDSKLQENVG